MRINSIGSAPGKFNERVKKHKIPVNRTIMVFHF